MSEMYVLHAAHLKYMTQKIAKNSPSGHHCTTLSGCIFATKVCIDNRKKLLNSKANISSTCPHNIANFGPLAAEIGLGVWGTPANFNGFRVLPSLLQRRRSPEANQTFARCLAVSWAGTLFIHFRGLLPPEGILPGAIFILCHKVLRSPILAALLHVTPAAGISQTPAWYTE